MAYEIGVVGTPEADYEKAYQSLLPEKKPGPEDEKPEKGKKEIKEQDRFTFLKPLAIFNQSGENDLAYQHYLKKEKPDLLINVIDYDDLKAGLLLNLRITRAFRPVLVFLKGMDDLNAQQDEEILFQVERLTGCPVIQLSDGKVPERKKTLDLIDRLAKSGGNNLMYPFHGELQKTLQKVEAVTGAKKDPENALLILEGNRDAIEKADLKEEQLIEIAGIRDHFRRSLEWARFNPAINARLRFTKSFFKEETTRESSDACRKIDKILTNCYLGPLLFAAVLVGIYIFAITGPGRQIGRWLSERVLTQGLYNTAALFFGSRGISATAVSFFADGVVGGIISLLGFFPQVFLTLLVFVLLSESGYMARVVCLVKHFFARFGIDQDALNLIFNLHGYLPEQFRIRQQFWTEEDRKGAALLYPFIPSLRKIPLYVVYLAAFFPNQYWLGAVSFVLLVGAALFVCVLWNFKDRWSKPLMTTPMQMPDLRFPGLRMSLKRIFLSSLRFLSGAVFIGGIGGGVLWFLYHHTLMHGYVDAPYADYSKLAALLTPVFKPIGFVKWECTGSLLTGIFNQYLPLVSYSVLEGFDQATFVSMSTADIVFSLITPITAYAMVLFIVTMNLHSSGVRGMGKLIGYGKSTSQILLFQTIVSYLLSFAIFQIGSALLYNEGNLYSVIAAILVVAFVICVFAVQWENTARKRQMVEQSRKIFKVKKQADEPDS